MVIANTKSQQCLINKIKILFYRKAAKDAEFKYLVIASDSAEILMILNWIFSTYEIIILNKLFFALSAPLR